MEERRGSDCTARQPHAIERLNANFNFAYLSVGLRRVQCRDAIAVGSGGRAREGLPTG